MKVIYIAFGINILLIKWAISSSKLDVRHLPVEQILTRKHLIDMCVDEALYNHIDDGLFYVTEIAWDKSDFP
jgi:hypothetical protein